MLGGICSIDGRIVASDEARIPVDNLAFTYGYGVYENIKVRNGRLHFPEEHAERLLRSADILGIKVGHGTDDLLRILDEFAGALDEQSYNLKMLFVERLYVFAKRPKYLPKKAYTQGVRTTITEGERPFPQAKTLSMLTSYLAYRRASEEGAYDALLCNREGYVDEGTRTNLFCVKDGTVYTPPVSHVLDGVTRRHVIALCRELGIPVRNRRIRKDELPDFEGCFLTSTSAKVLPVRQIDSRAFAVPEIVKEIRDAYEKYEKNRTER